MFCKNCGKELLDKAAVCTNCGIWVKDEPLEEETAPVAPVEGVEKSAKLSKLFGIIAFALIQFINVFAYIIIPFHAGGPRLIFAVQVLALGILSFIFGLKCKKNVGVKYCSTLIFIFSTAMSMELVVDMIW